MHRTAKVERAAAEKLSGMVYSGPPLRSLAGRRLEMERAAAEKSGGPPLIRSRPDKEPTSPGAPPRPGTGAWFEKKPARLALRRRAGWVSYFRYFTVSL